MTRNKRKRRKWETRRRKRRMRGRKKNQEDEAATGGEEKVKPGEAFGTQAPCYQVASCKFQLLLLSQVALVVKNLPAMRETWVQSLGGEDPLEKGVATHSSLLAWRIPGTEEPGALQSMGIPESQP